MKVKCFELPAYDIAAGFEEIFHVAKEHNLDFGILSQNPVGMQEEAKIKGLLETKEVQGAAVSVGIGRITGKGFNFSPKLPYVSEDGIIVNVKRCEELGISDRLMKVNTHSHFEDAGGIHATLLSFLEAVVPYGALHYYSYDSDPEDANKAWHHRVAEEILQYIKGTFNRVNYEIQKKYEDRT